MMKIKVNGKEQTLESGPAAVSELLTICNVSQPEMVSVQLNGEFVKKDDYKTVQVKAGDEIDFLYFMGGGE